MSSEYRDNFYKYTPISQTSRDFRLIRILPSHKPFGPFRCGNIRIEIVQAVIDSAIEYDALSYAWDVPKRGTMPDRPIIVETPGGSQSLLIFKSLEIALINLQDKTSRLLFIDQICIDQNSPAEKEHQVGLMQNIYSNCVRVLVWLGPGTTPAERLFTYIKEITSEGILGRAIGPNVGHFPRVFKAVMDPAQEVTESEKRDRDDILNLLAQYGSRFPLDGMLDVLNRSWFTRLWTVQEACLAPEVVLVCGGSYLCFDCFRTGGLFYSIYNSYWIRNIQTPVSQSQLVLRDKILDLSMSTVRIFQERKMIHKTKQRKSLYDIILQYNVNGNKTKIGATWPEDRIYGLLGLAASDDPMKIQIKVDYTSGVCRVYSDTAALMLEHNVDVLLFSQFPKRCQQPVELPSWVPDWSMPLRIPPSYSNIHTPIFSAGGLSRDGIYYDSLMQRVTVKGVELGVITHLGQYELSIAPEKQVMDQVDYRSVSNFITEASHFVEVASADQEALRDNIPKMRLLRVADAGLTLSYLTEELGQERAITTLQDLHRNICLFGDSLSLSNDFVASYHISHILKPPGADCWYWIPASETDVMTFCAVNPIAAAKILLQGALDFISNTACFCISALRVSLSTWHIRLRYLFAPIDFRSLENARRRTFSTSFLSSESLEGNHMSVLLEYLQKNIGRRLYRTAEGHIGLCPRLAKPGDSVVVFLGGSVPHVIRKQPVGEDELWSYIGETYCDGMMHGEALSKGMECKRFILI